MLPTEKKKLKTTDGTKLSYKFYSPKTKSPKAMVVIVHGLNEHQDRYHHVVGHLNKKNYAVLTYDQRGHGHSDGLDSFVKKFDQFVDDLEEVVAFAKTKSKAKTFVVGHSMGGQVCANYFSRKPKIAGGVLSSANLKVGFKVPWIKEKLGLALAPILPKLKLPSEIDLNNLSHDRQVVEDYRKDPLVPQYGRLSLLAEIVKNQKTIFTKAPLINHPLLVQHGSDDGICSFKAAKEFYNRTKIKDKKFQTYPHFYHELFNEIGYEKVLDNLVEWLDAH